MISPGSPSSLASNDGIGGGAREDPPGGDLLDFGDAPGVDEQPHSIAAIILWRSAGSTPSARAASTQASASERIRCRVPAELGADRLRDRRHRLGVPEPRAPRGSRAWCVAAARRRPSAPARACAATTASASRSGWPATIGRAELGGIGRRPRARCAPRARSGRPAGGASRRAGSGSVEARWGGSRS